MLMDKYFEAFLEEFGEPTSAKPATAEVVERFRGKLPDKLLAYWQRYGFCSFGNGLFSIVNPDDFEAELEAWVGDTKLVEEDAYYVIARSGFGDLLLWGTKTGYRYRVRPMYGWILQLDGNAAEIATAGADSAIEGFFCTKTAKYFDEKDEDSKPLFERAVAKHGPLAADEVFAFEPALALGGTAKLDNIAKRNMHVHLSVLAQLGHREILDRQALTRKAFG